MTKLTESEARLSEPAVKLADTSVPVHDLIRERWSPRSFSDRLISDEDLTSLLEAARWASSSNNEQPWRFFVARRSDPREFQKLFDLLLPGNQSWAGKAAVLMIMAAKKTFSNSGGVNDFAMHDTGQALAQLALQAVALGLHVHAVAGFDRSRAIRDLNMPEDYEPGAALAVGYAGPPDQLPEKYRDSEMKKRQRKALDEIVFGAGWQTPAPVK